MAENSEIEWTDHTWNPWIGCTKVSPGCAHCYAETLAGRYGWAEWGPGRPRRRTSDENWLKPIRWNRRALATGRPERVFCASLSDWLDEEVPWEWLCDLVALIDKTPGLVWLLLTKRPDRIANVWSPGPVPPNVWLGTSAEDQKRWNERVPVLLEVPAECHFVSAEPLLGPINMAPHFPDWLIVGGESGPGARPMSEDWVRDLRDQCDPLVTGAATKFFFKQWGGTNKKAAGRLLDGQVHNEAPPILTT